MTPIIAWARSGAGQPESQEAQRRLGDDDAADVDAEDDDDRRPDIGQDMANQYSPLETANRLRGLKIRVLFDPNHGAADDSGARNASGDPQHHDDLEDPRSHDRHDGEQEEQSREGYPGIDKTLHRQVHFPPKESRSAANQDGDDHIECSRCQTSGTRVLPW